MHDKVICSVWYKFRTFKICFMFLLFRYNTRVQNIHLCVKPNLLSSLMNEWWSLLKYIYNKYIFLNTTFCSILYQYSSCKMYIEQSLTKKILKMQKILYLFNRKQKLLLDNRLKQWYCNLHVTRIMKWALLNVGI